MKFITASLLFTIIIFPSIAQAGCVAREDITTKIFVTPRLSCLEIHAGPDCTGSVTLDIKNNCDDIFVYEENNQKIELYKYTGKSGVIYYVYDSSIPQDYGSWSRELYYKNNPERKILITAENKRVNPLTIIIFNLIPMLVDVIIIGFIIIALLLYLFHKKRVNT